MKIKITLVLILSIIISAIVWAKTLSEEKFSLAKDLSKGSVVYLQTDDLPQLIKLWDESKLKEKYLESQNFKEFQNSHLGIKLAERFTDFQTAIGFPLELSTLSGLAEKQAAVAIYDIGKLDFVFVAPMNEEIFSAMMFAQNSSKFAESKLEDGTSFYQIEFKVDRERQNQKLIFANIKGRFILATSDKLFLQTISATNGKHRLYDESNFKKLSARITPNLATIWVNQEKLNADYYFKRYWLMSKVEDLQNIQAGIFDLNFSEKGLTEKREFLLKEPQISEQISPNEANDLLAKVPENVPFYRLQKADENQLGEMIYNTLFDKQTVEQTSRKYSKHWSYDDTYDFYEKDYYYLDSDFDTQIDEKDLEEIVETKPFPISQISDALNSANPSTILTATSPKILENPLFVEFRKVAIISLKNRNKFQSNRFENSIVEALKNRVTVADTNFIWETENGLRKLKIPMLGWEIGYQLKNDKLFIADSFEFLQECVLTENKTKSETNNFSDLTVIRFANHNENFDNVMKKLNLESDDFFTGNVGSILDVMENVRQVEIKRSSDDNFLHEEILVRNNTNDALVETDQSDKKVRED